MGLGDKNKNVRIEEKKKKKRSRDMILESTEGFSTYSHISHMCFPMSPLQRINIETLK
jgi:hypothetical protein